MFTGIIKHQGRVVQNNNHQLTLQMPVRVASGLNLGDSIAVNGVCLSVFKKRGNQFTFDIMQETLRVSNLGLLTAGNEVNIEKPLRLGDALGGHLVLGHVEGVGRIMSCGQEWVIQIPRHLMRYIALKGSIALDGVSLTVAKKHGTTTTISLLSDTLRRTNFHTKSVGDTLNVETDALAKLFI